MTHCSYPFRNIFARLLSGICLTMLAGPALAASSAPVAPLAQPLYPWKTESAADEKSGTLKHCLVKNVFDNATLLILAENNEGNQRLAIHFTEDRLEQGLLVDLALQVDKGDTFPVEGMTTTKRILAMNVPAVLPEQMRKGNVLYIRGPQDEISYSMKGAGKAIQALRDCVASHKNPQAARAVLEEARQSDLALDRTAPATAVTTKAATASKAIVDTEKTALAKPVLPPAPPVATTGKTAATLSPEWAGIFRSASLSPDAKQAEKPHFVPALQQVWHSAGFTVGFSHGKGISHDLMERNAKDYLLGMKQDCKGAFIAEASAPVTTSNGKIRWQIAETVCSDSGSKPVMSALLFTTSADGAVTIAVRGNLEQAKDAIRKRNAFFELLRTR